MYPAAGEAESHGGAGLGVIGPDGDCATVFLDDRFRKKEPDSDSLTLGGEKWLENVSRGRWLDTFASVGEAYHKVAVALLEAKRQLPSVGHRLGGVGDDIDKTGPDLLAVHAQHGRHFLTLLGDINTLTPETRIR